MRVACTLLITALLWGCGGGDPAPPADASDAAEQASGLLPVVPPDLGRMNEETRRELEQRQAPLLAAIAEGGGDSRRLSQSYGELAGLYLAAGFAETSVPCLKNAAALDPSEFRWPYYLAHVHRGLGDAERAVAFFGQALKLRPNDLPARVWLGRTHLDRGDLEQAEARFRQALETAPQESSALFGLGKTLVARREFAAAIDPLEQALELTPQATIIHYSLALAHRGLGDTARAAEHLEKKGELDLLPPDPLMDEIRELLTGPTVLAHRGAMLYANGRWDEAAAAFGRALDGAPQDPMMHLNMGSALYKLGQLEGATARFSEALRLAPEYARAHYSLGAVLENDGAHKQALERYETALRYEPGYLPARLRLAHTQRRLGELERAIDNYGAVIDTDKRHAGARLGQAMALVRLGRYVQARQRLEEAMRVLPDQPAFAHALARLLAACPDDEVRDGPRAMQILEQLNRGQQSSDLAETIAMALAEVGQFERAAEWQRAVIDAARQAGRHDAVRRMTESQASYDRGEPCRVPWRDDDPIHFPALDAEPARPERPSAS